MGPSIPTWFGRTLYRSRGEARWAKFFTALDLKFEYEVQGFDLDGIWYLPDFVVFAATGIIWCEVKPSWTHDPDGIEKFYRFIPLRPQPSRAALLIGQPSVGEGHVMVYGGDEDADDPLKGPWNDDTQEWRPCSSGYHFDLAYAGTFGAKFAEDGCADDFGGDGIEKLKKAIEAARSAKFGKGDD